jgi:hypothetical protein
MSDSRNSPADSILEVTKVFTFRIPVGSIKNDLFAKELVRGIVFIVKRFDSHAIILIQVNINVIYFTGIQIRQMVRGP